MRLTGAQALVRLLAAEGVGLAFGIVGGKLSPLLHALSQQSALRWVGVRHESSAGMMAAAAVAGSGRLALAVGEMGPGALNLAAGIGGAFNNRLPLLAITTNQHRAAAYPHAGMFMDLDAQALFKPITVWNAVVHDGRRLPELVRSAFRHAWGPRPGPVHLDIPQDVLAAPVDVADDAFDLPPQRYRALQGARPAAADVQAAVALLRAAQRPLIVAGGGVVAAEAAPLVRELAARTGAALVPTQMALGVLPSDDPLFIGHGGLIAGAPVWQAFEQADVIVSVGCRWSSWLWDDRGPFARRSHRLVNINLDSSALGAPAVHEVAMAADAAAALHDLLAAWGPQPQARDDWRRQLAALRRQQHDQLQALADDASADPAQPLHPAALARTLGQAMPADALAVFDGGHTTFWSNDFTPVRSPRTRLHEPGMSHLGFGLPSALALQLLHPGRPVFNITGDGSFGFTVGELDSARRHGLPVVTVVHNNAAWGIIRHGQRAQLDFELGTALDGTDHAAIARGFGCHGATVQRLADLAPAIARALASGLPSVIDCRVRFVPHPCMPGFGRMNRFGFEPPTPGR